MIADAVALESQSLKLQRTGGATARRKLSVLRRLLSQLGLSGATGQRKKKRRKERGGGRDDDDDYF